MAIYPIRTATEEDSYAISILIKRSARALALNYYSKEQIEGALETAWGLDSQLLKDGSYFVVEDAGKLIAAGGWSYRKTLFGNNSEADRNPELLNPTTDYAKIRAFFVDPDYARKGIGTQIMIHCEQQAIHKGFSKLELMSTLPGVPLYQRHGFEGDEITIYKISDRLSIDFIQMTKTLSS